MGVNFWVDFRTDGLPSDESVSSIEKDAVPILESLYLLLDSVAGFMERSFAPGVLESFSWTP